jgi:hypothetical protein
MDITTIGLDLAKSIFQVHGVDANGRVVIRKSLRRAQMLRHSSPGCPRAWSAWNHAAPRIIGRVS